MANSKITITFHTNFEIGDIIRFGRRKINDHLTFFKEKETYAAFRTQSFLIPVIVEGGELEEFNDTINYYKLFNLDYNISNLYTLTQNYNTNIVTIEFTNSDWEFYDFFATNGNATAVIENYVEPVGTITIDNSIISESLIDACGYVNLEIETNVLADKIYLNDILVVDGNLENPFNLEIIRGATFIVRVESFQGQIAYFPSLYGQAYPNQYYDYLLVSNVNINIVQSLSGATLNVIVSDIFALSLEYSLDNINWQTSNIFTGQPNGDGIIYIKDQYGCEISKEYTVTALGTREPYLSISNANAVNFIKIEEIDNCNTFKNDGNTFAYNSLSRMSYCEDILFQTCDITTIQIKTNFEETEFKLRNINGDETIINGDVKTANLNRFESMDCFYYKYKTGELGIYFNNGNTYDEFGTVIGDYALNGNLPDFAIVGQQVDLGGSIGIHTIKYIAYDENKNKRVIVIDYTYEGTDVSHIVSSRYDLLNFEVVEFDINWILFEPNTYDIVITNSDTNNDTVIHNSENINLAVEHDALAIRYYNNNNKDIFYKYGIEHFIRMPYIYIKGEPKDETEINIGDNISTVVKSTLYEVDEIKFDDVTKGIMRKLSIALSSENLFVNGVGYVKDGSISVTNPDNTNIYEVTVKLLKTNINYNNNKEGKVGVDADYEALNIPAIITDGSGFIKS